MSGFKVRIWGNGALNRPYFEVSCIDSLGVFREKTRMARKCELTGKTVQFGNTVSNANNRNRTQFHPNLTSKRLFVPELKAFVEVRVSQRALRTIDKLGGLLPACRRYKKTISARLAKVLKRAA